jgi:hypothetical protein
MRGGRSGSGAHTVPLSGNLLSGVQTGFGFAATGARTVPPTGHSYDPLPTIPMRMTLVAINSGTAVTAGDPSTDSDVQILDVCSVPRCRDTSTSMISCLQCKKYIFCGKGCVRKCPYLQLSDQMFSTEPAYEADFLNNLNGVSNLSTVTQTCNYCGSQVQGVDGTCSVCYDKYCLRSCTCAF